MEEPRFEYRLGWSAASNIRFHGTTAWMPWDGWEETATDVEVAIERGQQLSPGLEQVIDHSGFEWYAEVREVGTSG